MKFIKSLAILTTAAALSACNMGNINNSASTPAGSNGMSICQASQMALNGIDMALPTVQLWDTLLTSVASASNYTLPAAPSMGEDSKAYYQLALIGLNTTLQMQGCADSRMDSIINRQLNGG